jgi:hypothetical protein
MKTCCFLLVFALLLAPTGFPQASSSTVRGTVLDQAQAVVPGANVNLINADTNVARTTVTNQSGLYVFPGVTPGQYRLIVEARGFQKFEGSLTVQVQQDAEVDARLEVGQTTTQVEVQDVTPMVSVDSPTLGHVLERKRIEELPINGRGYQALLQTVPGIDSTGLVQAYGMRTDTSVTLFDGSPVNEVWEGWDFGRPPGLDAVEEMHVEVNNSSAKFMRPTTIVLSSRSGTNQVHGAAFETNRNSGYGVARRREDTFVKPPYLNRNEYGVSLGGPVYIPKVYNGHDRTFFFFAWEGNHNIQNSTQLWMVPTAAMRAGDFRGLVDSQGRPYTLYDPLTTNPQTWSRDPLTYHDIPNMIDPARLSPTAKYLFGVTPLPTLPQVNPLIDNNWVGPVPRLSRENTTSVRIDHRFSSSDLIYGRFSYGTHYEEYQYPGQEMLDRVSGLDIRWWPNHTASTTWVHTFSSSMTNELLVNGSRDYQRRGAGDFKTNYAHNLGLPNPFQFPNWPTINGTDLGNYSFGGDGNFFLITNFVNLQDNATKVIGKHEFQFGFQTHFEIIDKSSNSVAGSFSYATLGTALYDPTSTASNPIAKAFTGFGLANMYLGDMNYQAGFRRPWFHFRRQEYDPYFQDNWKVTKRLTLNLGLRYDMRTPLHDRDHTLLGFDLNKHAYVIGTSLNQFVNKGVTLPSIVTALQNFGGNVITNQDAGLPQNLIYMNWKQFGPRLGFAYRALDGRKQFVIRGGYRVSYYPQKLQDWVGAQSSSAPVGANFQYSVTNTALSPDGLPNYGLRSAPQYVAGVNTPDSLININDTRLLTRGFSVQLLDSHIRDGKVQDWNFTIEKEVVPNMVVRAAYVGNYSTNQQQWVDYNDATPDYIWYTTTHQPLPTGEFASVATRPYDKQVFGTINFFTPSGYSHHNSFQFEMERRFHKGLAFQVFYRTAKTLLTNRDTDSTQGPDSVLGVNNFLPNAVPTDTSQRNKFLNYKLDPNTPKHQVRWNFIADLPFGQGKPILHNAKGVVQKLVGGWQIAGTGQWKSTYWTLPTSIYPTGTPVQIYGHQYPIQDCRSGICYPGYLYWNGYIPANKINSYDANGKPNGVMGVPANYKPAGAPLIPWGSTALPANAPTGTSLQQFWDTNTVWIPLANGTVQRTTYNDGLPPWRNQYIDGVHQWFEDASLFKFFAIKERVTLRFNIDFFNVLNTPNDPTGVGSDGVLGTRTSGSAARVTQLTLRLIW